MSRFTIAWLISLLMTKKNGSSLLLLDCRLPKKLLEADRDSGGEVDEWYGAEPLASFLSRGLVPT